MSDHPNPLRVWWIPQVPMEAFHVDVQSPREAMLVLDTLARYDLFQYENNVKPDYTNMGGTEELVDGEWETVDDEELEDMVANADGDAWVTS